jgi:hypothetical protein
MSYSPQLPRTKDEVPRCPSYRLFIDWLYILLPSKERIASAPMERYSITRRIPTEELLVIYLRKADNPLVFYDTYSSGMSLCHCLARHLSDISGTPLVTQW